MFTRYGHSTYLVISGPHVRRDSGRGVWGPSLPQRKQGGLRGALAPLSIWHIFIWFNILVQIIGDNGCVKASVDLSCNPELSSKSVMLHQLMSKHAFLSHHDASRASPPSKWLLHVLFKQESKLPPWQHDHRLPHQRDLQPYKPTVLPKTAENNKTTNNIYIYI